MLMLGKMSQELDLGKMFEELFSTSEKYLQSRNTYKSLSAIVTMILYCKVCPFEAFLDFHLKYQLKNEHTSVH